MASKVVKKFLKFFKRKCNTFEKSNQSKDNIIYYFSCCGLEGELWVYKDDVELILTCGESAPYMIIEFDRDVRGEVEVDIDTYDGGKLDEECKKKWKEFVEEVIELLASTFPNSIITTTSGVLEEDEDFEWFYQDDRVDRVIVEITK